MLSPKTFAFVDESGNTSLNLSSPGVSSHFVILATIVKGTDLERARERASEIRRDAFGQGEMKSSGIAGDDARRVRVLNALRALPVTFYAFVVDKREVWKTSGLIYKKPFLKFLHGKVYNRLFRTFPNLDVIADEHGTIEFMDGFRSYVAENHQPTLFETSTFRFTRSEDDSLLQASDIVAGSIARLFEESRRTSDPHALLAALSGKIVSLEEWPPVYHDLSLRISSAVAHDHDGMVREYCKNQAALYLRELDPAMDEDRLREAVLTHLADQSRYTDSDRYVSGAEIVSHLEDVGFTDVSIHILRSTVINHFRDHGVIIASNNTGYKLPTVVSDISNYVERCDAVIRPMISRLRGARDQIRMMSHNELDILAPERYEFLRTLAGASIHA